RPADAVRFLADPNRGAAEPSWSELDRGGQEDRLWRLQASAQRMNPVGRRHPGSPAAHKYAGTAKSHRRMDSLSLSARSERSRSALLGEWEQGCPYLHAHGERQDYRLQRHSAVLFERKQS